MTTWEIDIPIGGSMDHPFYEVAATAKDAMDRGGKVYQKYTCSGCGERLMMDEPNVFYKTGRCDKCGTVTNIEEQGCNYMLVFDAEAIAEAKEHGDG